MTYVCVLFPHDQLQERSRNSALVAQAAKDQPKDQLQIPTMDSAAESQLQPDQRSRLSSSRTMSLTRQH